MKPWAKLCRGSVTLCRCTPRAQMFAERRLGEGGRWQRNRGAPTPGGSTQGRCEQPGLPLEVTDFALLRVASALSNYRRNCKEWKYWYNWQVFASGLHGILTSLHFWLCFPPLSSSLSLSIPWTLHSSFPATLGKASCRQRHRNPAAWGLPRGLLSTTVLLLTRIPRRA